MRPCFMRCVAALAGVLFGFAPAALATGMKTPVVQRPRSVVIRDDVRASKDDRPRFENRFADAKRKAADGHFNEAVVSLLRTLSETQPTSEQQVRAYELLATCFVALRDRELAIGLFHELLRLRPDFACDLARTSPKVCAVLDEARRRF